MTRYYKKSINKLFLYYTIKNQNKDLIHFIIHSVLNFLVFRSQKVDLDGKAG